MTAIRVNTIPATCRVKDCEAHWTLYSFDPDYRIIRICGAHGAELVAEQWPVSAFPIIAPPSQYASHA